MAISDYFELQKIAPLALIPIALAAFNWWRNRWGAFTVEMSDQSIAKKETKVEFRTSHDNAAAFLSSPLCRVG